MPYDVKNAVWKKLFRVLRTIPGIHLRHERRVRRFVDAVLDVCRSGCQWRLLPWVYGKWRTVHARFKSWSQKGVWEKLFENLKDAPDHEALMMDATIVRAHACASGYGNQENEALGRSKGGFTTKIHALVDGLGNPLAFRLTGGQRHEITQAEALLGDHRGTWVIADKGYDRNALIQHIQEKHGTPVIPPRKNRKNPRDDDKHWYRERHLIPCFFGQMKHFRRVFSRFDKSAQAFLSFLHIVGALIWIK